MLCLDIVIVAHGNVAMVILCFMDQKDEAALVSFLNGWHGPEVEGVQPKFTLAEGSSLNSAQMKNLTELKVPVVRQKGQKHLKVFVSGPGSSLYSTIIRREDLESLSKDLSELGVNFSAPDRRRYGLKS